MLYLLQREKNATKNGVVQMLYSELQCSEAIHKAVERMGFAEMTEIQEKTIPLMPVSYTHLMQNKNWYIHKISTIMRIK